MNTLREFVEYKLTHCDKTAEANGYPLKMENCKKNKKMRDLKVYGNSVQDGTPTPDVPVEVQSVGEKSVNLLEDARDIYNGNGAEDSGIATRYTETIEDGRECVKFENTPNIIYRKIKFKENTQYTFSFDYKCVKQGGYTSYPPYDIPLRIYYTNGNIKAITIANDGIWRRLTFTSAENSTIDYIGGISFDYRDYMYIDINSFQIQEGSTATPYEPYGKYKIPVVTRGINYFSMAKTTATAQTINGITFTPLGDERVQVKGTATADAYYYLYAKNAKNMVLKAGTYKSKPFNELGISILFGCRYLDGTGAGNINSLHSSATFNSDTYIANALVYVTKGTIVDNIVEIQLMKGTENLPYEPYVEPVTTNIFLKEPLRKIGDYADYIDFKENKVVRNVDKKLVNDETDDKWMWIVNYDTEDALSVYRDGYINYSNPPYQSSHQIFSSYFPYNFYNKTNKNRVWNYYSSCGFIISTDLIDGYSYSWSNRQKIDAFLQWAKSIGLDWYLARKTPREEPLNIDLPKLTAKTTIIEVDTNLLPSNAYGKYIKK